MATLEEARAEGLSRYFTGEPCLRGHVAERITANQTCSACVVENKRRTYHANREAIRLDNRERYRKNRPARLASERANKLRIRYGMTVADYDLMLEAQGGVCAICEAAPNSPRNASKGRLCLDHDHRTGTPRSLLCSACNSALGYLDDNPELLMKAANYLRLAGNSIVPQIAAEVLRALLETL